MGKAKKMKGSQSFRQRMLFSILSSKRITIEDIRSDDSNPGLRHHELSLIRLFDTVCDDSVTEINETGTILKYKPGIIMGGKNLVHNCALTRSIGYYLEPLIVLGLFGKKPLSIRLKGITNDARDPSVDTIRSTTLNILKRFGVPGEELDLIIEARGVAPEGGGEVLLTVPNVQSLTAVRWFEEGMVKKIRGTTFSTRVSSNFERSMRIAARGIFNNLLPDVHISVDHKSGSQAGKLFHICSTTVSCGKRDENGDLEVEKQERVPSEDTGVEVASWLLHEIEKGGVVDSTHQGLLFILCALCQQDISKVRVGTLSPHGLETLRNIKEFLDVTFHISPDPSTGTVMLKCAGSGLVNLSRKLS